MWHYRRATLQITVDRPVVSSCPTVKISRYSGLTVKITSVLIILTQIDRDWSTGLNATTISKRRSRPIKSWFCSFRFDVDFGKFWSTANCNGGTVSAALEQCDRVRLNCFVFKRSVFSKNITNIYIWCLRWRRSGTLFSSVVPFTSHHEWRKTVQRSDKILPLTMTGADGDILGPLLC